MHAHPHPHIHTHTHAYTHTQSLVWLVHFNETERPEPRPTAGENKYSNINQNYESTNIPSTYFDEWLLIQHLFGGSI